LRAVGDTLGVSSSLIRKFTSEAVRHYLTEKYFDAPELWVPREFIQQAIDIKLWDDPDVFLFWKQFYLRMQKPSVFR
jgi:hypothetical protein